LSEIATARLAEPTRHNVGFLGLPWQVAQQTLPQLGDIFCFCPTHAHPFSNPAGIAEGLAACMGR